MSCLFDTNILVYRHDPRDPLKQQVATDLLRASLKEGQAWIAHQCLMEFVAATTRPLRGESGRSLLSSREAACEAEDLCRQFEVLYPESGQFITALRGWRTYGMNWFDAHLWSFAEYYRVDEIFSEDFQHGRRYGNVRVVNPFL